MTVVLSGPGDRAILTMPGTIAGLRAELIDPSLLARARHVHVSSYYLQTALVPSLPGIFDAVHGHGATTSVDPNWDPSELGRRTARAAPQDRRLHAERDGGDAPCATSDLEDAVRTLGTRSDLVVVKNGDHGAIAGGQGQLHRVAGLGTAVVDTTGAGDSFDAGFLAAWLGGEPIERALAIANVCGALSTRAMGGVDAQPTMDEAIALLEEGSAA